MLSTVIAGSSSGVMTKLPSSQYVLGGYREQGTGQADLLVAQSITSLRLVHEGSRADDAGRDTGACAADGEDASTASLCLGSAQVR